MSLRTIASLAIALFLGLIAVILVRGVLVSQRPPPGTDPAIGAAMSPVVVAALPIQRGVDLKSPMLKLVNYPRDAVPAGAFTSLDQLTGKAAPARTTLRAMAANEPVLASKLSGPGGKTNLSGTLTPGMRAISVRSSDVAGVGGFVLPGDRVDIYITRTIGNGEGSSTVTQVLAENALVLGVDQTSDQEADKPVVAKAVTVEVTPDQAQAVSLGQAVGQVSLALRQVADSGPLARKATTVADLGAFGLRKTALAGGPARPRTPGPARVKTGSATTEVHVTRGVETTGYPVGTY